MKSNTKIILEGLKKYLNQNLIEAGLDEAGRGCLAGPVVAGAVVLPIDFYHPLLNDSKQVKKSDRDLLRKVIEENAISYAIGILDHQAIDEINILRASIKAMNLAVSKLKVKPEFLLVDGNRFYPEHNIDFKCIVKGDSIFASIAAASVLAKTYRDEIMDELHEKHPEYNWKSNKGYPTIEHRKAIIKYGISPYHRKSFRLLNNEQQLDFGF